MRKAILLICGTILSVTSCRKDASPPASNPADTPVVLTPYVIRQIPYFPQMIVPEDNQPYAEKIQLGRMLYYDTILSNDGRACASCHVQQKGFTSDFFAYNMPVLPHVNLAWNSNFMWDGSKQGKLEDVMLFEVKVFFGTNLAKLNSNPKYRSLFKKYFGVAEITYKELSYALAQFVRTMNSGNSKYDRYLLGNEELSYDEMQGRNLFFTEKGDCYHCHLNPVLTDNQLHNTGLDSLYAKEADKGFYNVSLDKKDLGKFKTPSLRNVALRSRFMHDGRFSTLDEVIEFYNSGVRKVENLDPIMTKPGKENGLKLTAWEKRQLIIFLQTFTDSAFISSPALSRP